MKELTSIQKEELKEFLEKEMEELSLSIRKIDLERKELNSKYMQLCLLLDTL
jgi:hypothetical protein